MFLLIRSLTYSPVSICHHKPGHSHLNLLPIIDHSSQLVKMLFKVSFIFFLASILHLGSAAPAQREVTERDCVQSPKCLHTIFDYLPTPFDDPNHAASYCACSDGSAVPYCDPCPGDAGYTGWYKDGRQVPANTPGAQDSGNHGKRDWLPTEFQGHSDDYRECPQGNAVPYGAPCPGEAGYTGWYLNGEQVAAGTPGAQDSGNH